MADVFAALSLDSYAGYVWAAYGVTALGLAAMVAGCVIERQRLKRRLRASAARDHSSRSEVEAP